MPQVHFTPNLKKHLDCPPTEVVGRTVREALDVVFAENRRLRGYILDDQSRLRKHVTIFVDNQMIRDRSHLSDAVTSESEIYVMQALSGG
ncbi:MAG: MoaD/ThiS family protein [Planctomycetaceae bacterium]|nr:MoaD/ThiS family protein [Planctomycetaceae bacterium]